MQNNKNNKLAFVFPGQGSQAIGMLAELAVKYPVVKQVFTQASDVLAFDLWDLVQHGTVENLNKTYHTQPAMLAAGYAVWQVWCQQSPLRPAWMAGHSLGEYTALVCANALSFNDAIALVDYRGRLMQEAVPAGTGAMAAILGLEDQQVVDICVDVAEMEVVEPVNFNAPGQIVIAGHSAAVERAIVAAKALGAKIVKLPVSVPSHCLLMQTAAEKLYEKLIDTPMSLPDVTLIHNVDVNSHYSIAGIRNVLKEQLFKSVCWTQSIRKLHELGVETFVEAGPGKVLTGMNKRIVKDATHLTIHDSASLEKVLEHIDG